jgi:hypothetical protein
MLLVGTALIFFIFLLFLCRDVYRRSKGAGAGKTSRNATKKRNKYGKIDKSAGRVEAEW